MSNKIYDAWYISTTSIAKLRTIRSYLLSNKNKKETTIKDKSALQDMYDFLLSIEDNVLFGESLAEFIKKHKEE